ncbi:MULTISPECIES: hypothetical protein [unclassified Novosphingobium]|uniref:hypothetical protein n=1 Tax=unclassified Novosphingobium TaxID=2644732 RepID=UPI000D2FE125|nr:MULTISPECIES: hypothetical protein [unclassified Novosphingobium]PTR10916.1 hypothetical protein C8K11_10645 [Novosphingobium sp. GV055]PUB03466.1 hypothetical protein C8K12_10645 [Novosphingobium sp. GV061]PUB19921.1 hypothetical protein C8K14_10645 [Novosphingobium sp. GV079]PUB41682.1 hypothetical protein C8K10_10645 [Novosphingobium sp. GV027]
MTIDWTQRAWLEWSATHSEAEPKPFIKVESVRPEPLAKIVRLMLRWNIDTRKSFRIVTDSGLILNASALEQVVQDGRFPFPPVVAEAPGASPADHA